MIKHHGFEWVEREGEGLHYITIVEEGVDDVVGPAIAGKLC